MARHAAELECSTEDRASLVTLTKSGTAEARVVEIAGTCCGNPPAFFISNWIRSQYAPVRFLGNSLQYFKPMPSIGKVLKKFASRTTAARAV